MAHGMTAITDTRNFGYFQKNNGDAGGLAVVGLSELTGGLTLAGIESTDDTAKSSAALGSVILKGWQKNGASIAALDPNENVLVVRNGGSTNFIIDAQGDVFQAAGAVWHNFDAWDDLQLLTLLSVHVSRSDDPIRGDFAEFLAHNREELERLGLTTFSKDGPPFVNMSRLTMLLTGAVRQLGMQVREDHERLRKLEARVQRLTDATP